MADVSIIGLLARLAVSLAVVLGLMLGAAWVLRRRGTGFTRSASGATEVLARQTLSGTASLQVIRVGERALVIGVTDQSVTYLSEADLDELRPAAIDMRGGSAMGRVIDHDGSGATRTAPSGGATDGSGSGSTWTGFVEGLRDRTSRR